MIFKKFFKNIQNADYEQRNDWIKIQSSKAVWLLIAIFFTLLYKTEVGMLTLAFAGASNAKDQYKYSEKYEELPEDSIGYNTLIIFTAIVIVFLFPKMQELIDLLLNLHFPSAYVVLVFFLKIILVSFIYFFYLFIFEWLLGSIYGTINLKFSNFLKNNK